MKNSVDFMKIHDGDKLIGVLNINSIIPVNESVITPLNTRVSKSDSPAEANYKRMAKKQLEFCQKNQDTISNRANRLYKMVQSEKVSGFLRRFCCAFLKLEHVLDLYDKHT